MSFGDSLARETAAPRRWLSIVGIGEDGVEPRFVRTVHGVGYAFQETS